MGIRASVSLTDSDLSFAVIKKIGAPRNHRNAFGSFYLPPSEFEFALFLQPSLFARERRCPALAPIVFNGYEQQGGAAENGQQAYDCQDQDPRGHIFYDTSTRAALAKPLDGPSPGYKLNDEDHERDHKQNVYQISHRRTCKSKPERP